MREGAAVATGRWEGAMGIGWKPWQGWLRGTTAAAARPPQPQGWGHAVPVRGPGGEAACFHARSQCSLEVAGCRDAPLSPPPYLPLMYPSVLFCRGVTALMVVVVVVVSVASAINRALVTPHAYRTLVETDRHSRTSSTALSGVDWNVVEIITVTSYLSIADFRSFRRLPRCEGRGKRTR
jgi:hypothetical protein